jgi:hydrogenase maturation protease
MTTNIPDDILSATEAADHLNSDRTIVLGIGNKSRGDDGLGWAFLGKLEEYGGFLGDIEYRYLLLVEDASLIAEYDHVIFVDASHEELKNGFEFRKIEAGSEFEFSTHIIPPESILYLTEELYEKHPGAYTLAISGLDWGLGKDLGDYAAGNLERAAEWFKSQVLDR